MQDHSFALLLFWIRLVCVAALGAEPYRHINREPIGRKDETGRDITKKDDTGCVEQKSLSPPRWVGPSADDD